MKPVHSARGMHHGPPALCEFGNQAVWAGPWSRAGCYPASAR